MTTEGLYAILSEQKEQMKLIYQPLGTADYVGIESNDEQEIIEQYYSFWNHGATGGKLHWMSDSFAYIATNEKQLDDYFHNSSYHLLLNNYPDTWEGKEDSEEFHAEVHKLAEKRLAKLMVNRETFHSTNPRTFDYSLGKTESHSMDLATQPFDEEAYKQGYEQKQRSAAKLLGD